MLIFGMNPLVVAAAIRRHRQAACVAVLFLISGATGLVYQVIWTRRLILLFGTTAHAVSAVLAVISWGWPWEAFGADAWPTVRVFRCYGTDFSR